MYVCEYITLVSAHILTTYVYICMYMYVQTYSQLGGRLEALPLVLVPEGVRAVGAGGGEGAVAVVEGDGVDGVDLFVVVLVVWAGERGGGRGSRPLNPRRDQSPIDDV